MRVPLIIVLLLHLYGCNSDKKHLQNLGAAVKKWEINLESVHSRLYFELPVEYDTVFSWILDNGHCPAKKYRFQSKHYPTYEDGCYIDPLVPYKKWQITIFEPIYNLNSLPNIDTNEIIKIHASTVEQSLHDPQAVLTQFDTLFRVNGKIYPIVSNMTRDIIHRSYLLSLQTAIYLNGNAVKVLFEQSCDRFPLDRSDFVNTCLSIIRTIKENNGI